MDVFLTCLEKIDILELTANIFYEPLNNNLDERLISFLKIHIEHESKAVLGLDIYKYSDFYEGRNPLISFLFNLSLDCSLKYSKETKSTFFKNYYIRNYFIFIFDVDFFICFIPSHSLLYNLYTLSYIKEVRLI